MFILFFPSVWQMTVIVMLCKRVMESCFLCRQCMSSGLKEISPDIN